jgi:hypothetical protein
MYLFMCINVYLYLCVFKFVNATFYICYKKMAGPLGGQVRICIFIYMYIYVHMCAFVYTLFINMY